MAESSSDLFMKCTIGAAEFQIEDYEVTASPVLRDVLNMRVLSQVGTDYRVITDGYILGSSAADLASKVQQLIQEASGGTRAFRIYSLANQVEFELLPPQCVSGPHVEVQMLPQRQAGMLRKSFRITVTATTSLEPPQGGNAVTDTFKVRTEEKPNRLRIVSRLGELRGTSVTTHFDGVTIAAFRAAYPLPFWVVRHTMEVDQQDGSVRYELSAEQLAEPLPEAASVEVFDGTETRRTEGDESGRLLITVSYDLQFIGEPYMLEQVLRQRAVGQNTYVVRESIEYTGLRDKRIRASWTLLGSREGNGLLDWQHEFTTLGEVVPKRVREYEGGGTPVIYHAPLPGFRYVQRGRAVGLGRYPREPDPILDAEHLAEPPRVTWRPLNAYERETTWEYVFLTTNALGAAVNRAALARPANPTFYNT